MKKIVSAVLVLIMMLAMGTMAFAADTFVPSITYKDALEVVEAHLVDENGNVIDLTADCLSYTSVADALTGDETVLPEVDTDLLVSLYRQLSNGTMELPAEELKKAGLEPKNAVIRDLMDVSLVCGDIHNHAEMLEKANVKLVITFRMKGIKVGDNVSVMTYKNDAWGSIDNVTVVADELVNCSFEHLCPVVFAVGPDGMPGMGVKISTELVMWACILVASAAVLVVVVSKRRNAA